MTSREINLASHTIADLIHKVMPSSNLLNASSISHQFSSVFHTLNLGSTHVIFLTVGLIIAIGVIGEEFFKKTRIPDIIFLMVIGTIVGPILGIIHLDTVIKISPYFSSLAVITILFYGGLTLDIRRVIRTAHFALFLAILGFVVSVAVVAAIAFYLLGWHLTASILLGVMVGGSSEAIVLGLVRGLRISEETKYILSLESVITGILSFIPAFLLFGAVTSGTLSLHDLEMSTVKEIVVGLVLGFGAGIPWLYISGRLAHVKHVHMFTLGILFILFFLARTYGESGALTALTFGLILGNKELFSGRLKLQALPPDDVFYEKLAFLVKTFFFVFIGLFASFGNLEYIVFGIVMSVALYFARIGAVRACFTKRFSLFDKKVAGIMLPRGLAPAVLATTAISMGLPNAGAYPQLVYIIILATVVITTVGLGKAAKQESQASSKDVHK